MHLIIVFSYFVNDQLLISKWSIALFTNQLFKSCQSFIRSLIESVSNVVNTGSYKAYSSGQLTMFVSSSKVRTIYAL